MLPTHEIDTLTMPATKAIDLAMAGNVADGIRH
jgi:hypothetical protein